MIVRAWLKSDRWQGRCACALCLSGHIDGVRHRLMWHLLLPDNSCLHPRVCTDQSLLLHPAGGLAHRVVTDTRGPTPGAAGGEVIGARSATAVIGPGRADTMRRGAPAGVPRLRSAG